MELVRDESGSGMVFDVRNPEEVIAATGWPLEAFTVLEQCLEVDPTKRASAKDILESDFVRLFAPGAEG